VNSAETVVPVEAALVPEPLVVISERKEKSPEKVVLMAAELRVPEPRMRPRSSKTS
jgi:hypothetical protein